MNTKNVLRWCAVPFAAALSAYLTFFLVSAWIKAAGWSGATVYIVTMVVSWILSGAAFVLCGTMVAPHRKRACAIALSVAISVIAVVMFGYVIAKSGFDPLLLLFPVAMILGSVLASSAWWKDKKL